jgi:hypothetical protein
MMTEQQALDLLNGMGQTADEVAAFLKEKGITGRVALALHCPVAAYLSSQGGDIGGAVYTQYASQNVLVKVPEPVFAFIRAFDAGKYPELVEVKQ